MPKIPRLYQIGLRFPKLVLGLGLIVSVLAFWAAQHLRIENNLLALLPPNFESIQGLKKIESRFGGLGFIVATVEANEEAKAKEFADQLSDRIEALPGVQYVDYRRPVEFFKERQWLYLDMSDLQEMEKRLDRSLVLQKKGVSPTFNSLMDFAEEEDRPDLTFQDIRDKYEKKFSMAENSSSSEEGNGFISLKIKTKSAQQNLDQSGELLVQIQSVVDDLKTKMMAQDVTVRFTGDHVQAMETVAFLRGRMALVSEVVMAILFLVLWLYFRKFVPVFLVGIPLMLGILWTGGAAFVLFKHLNILTGFAAGILGGLGSDYGIYLLGRYYQERSRGVDFRTACERGFGNTGKATFASMATTVFAFLALVFSDFKVSVEFGSVGALGLVFNYLAMMLLIPAALSLLEKTRLAKKAEQKATLEASKMTPVSPWLRLFYPRAAGIGVLLALTVCGISAFSLKSQSVMHFEDGRMDHLGLPGEALYEKVSKRYGGSLQPTVLLTEKWDEVGKIVEAFQKDAENTPPEQKTFKGVLGPSNFIPKDRDEKIALLSRLKDKFSQSHFPVKQKREELIASIAKSMALPPVTWEQIPIEVRRILSASGKPELYAVYLMPSFTELNWDWMRRYSEAVLRVRADNHLDFTPIDNPFVAREFVQMMEREGPKMVALTLAAILGVLLWSVRPWGRASLIFLNLLAALVMLSGILWLGGIATDTLNVAAIPIILGTGINCFIHFALRYDETKDVEEAIREKLPSIMVSNLTSMIGFASLLWVPSAGIRSLGWVALLGMVVMTIMCLLVFPRCLTLIARYQKNDFLNLKEGIVEA